jgi:hypothetical protein
MSAVPKPSAAAEPLVEVRGLQVAFGRGPKPSRAARRSP